MTNPSVLQRALDQLAALVSAVDGPQRNAPTPCDDWNVGQLIDHIAHATAQFGATARGEQVDWSVPAPQQDDPFAAFSQNADALVEAMAGSQLPVSMPAAELAVHTWDLATALGRDTDELDPEVAEAGFDFVSQNLTPDRRGDAFGPEQPAPDGANAYERLAAFTGRAVSRAS